MAMTLGKDVSALFPDVLKNIATSDLEQKKLVYLYLMWVLSACVAAAIHTDRPLCDNQELRQIPPGPLYSRCEHLRSRFRRP